MSLTEQLTIRLDRFTPVATRILLEFPGPGDPELALRGQIVGPFSAHARTLPTTVSFRSEATSQGLRAAALFPDFCGWSADHPQLYRVTAELQRAGQVQERLARIWGAALFGIRQDRFYWEGRRWVMRAIEPSTEHDSDQLRELDATWICREPTPSQCEHADREGIRIVARISLASYTKEGDLSGRLRQLARHPSVILVWLDGSPHGAAENLPPFTTPPTLLLAAHVRPDENVLLPSWARVGICPAEQLEQVLAQPSPRSHPLLILGSHSGAGPAELRRDCDRLQASVSRQGDFAGFLISHSS